MSGAPVILHGEEAEKVWAAFWRDALPHGQKLAKVCRTGTVAVLALGLPKGVFKPGKAVFPLDPGMRTKLIAQFDEIRDPISAEFLRAERPGRIIAFYGQGSFLLNLDLTKDPTKRESYSIEPGSLDADKMKASNFTGGALAEKLSQLEHIREAYGASGVELAKLIRESAVHEVNILEELMPSGEITFVDLLKLWGAKTSIPSVQHYDRAARKVVADQLTEEIHSEIVQRGLERWIINGEAVKAVDHQPSRALAALMSAKLNGLVDGKIQCPSGRWLHPEDIEKSIREMILPPLVTPNNIEVAMMSLARFAAFIEASRTKDILAMLEAWGSSRRNFFGDSQFAALIELIGFGVHWREMAFARLELGHKLASALMFTDAPESVQAPWLAWSLLLPDGIFGEVEIRRVWCLGDRPAVLLMKLGEHVGTMCLHVFAEYQEAWRIDPGPYNPDAGEKMPLTREKFEAMGPEFEEKFLRCIPMLQNLIRGVCLALSDPSDWRKGEWYGKPSGSEIKKASKHKELPVGERYVLGQPVQIDLREEVLDHVRTGKVGGASPTKLFLVRGHHRRQAHGPGHQLRKTIWIEPFWKGPEDARVLLRPHQA